MIRRALFLGAVSLVLALPSGSARAQSSKIGYVDLQRALAETEDGRRAKSQLKSEFDKKQKELDERSENLKKEIEDLNKKRTLLPEQTRLQKEQELAAKMKSVQEIYLRHQRDLAEKEAQATQPILERMQSILAKLAEDEGFLVIMDRNQLVFAKPELDLTNQLIRRYNAGEGKSAKPAAKAPAAKAPAAKAPAKTQ